MKPLTSSTLYAMRSKKRSASTASASESKKEGRRYG